jgi:hypothetical protein
MSSLGCTIDFEDDLGEFRFKECLLLLMLELVSAEIIDDDDEIVPSWMSVFVRANPEGRGAAFFFFFSVAVESREVACERKKVATLCGILRKPSSRRSPGNRGEWPLTKLF